MLVMSGNFVEAERSLPGDGTAIGDRAVNCRYLGSNREGPDKFDAHSSVPHSPIVVAIPARNEANELEGCLLALAAQQQAAIQTVVICLNNCTDDSATVVRGVAERVPFKTDVITQALSPDCACAGVARRLAMDRAAEIAAPDGVLLTTDADARVPSDWVAVNLAAITAGADAVAGRAEIDPVGARLIPDRLHTIVAGECAYARLLDEIGSLLDPDPADPWPRHDEHHGASIAVTVAAYRRAGGMSVAPLAEDRAFFDALRRVDARIRHAPEVRVVVSARLHGRALGGMADTMRRRIIQMDPFLDARVEPAKAAARRAHTRGKLRRMWAVGSARVSELSQVAARLGIRMESLALRFEIVPTLWRAEADKCPHSRSAGRPHFGTAWGQLEQQCRMLHRRLVPPDSLPAETAHARRIRNWLRHAIDQVDTPIPVAAE
jgi:Glycosyltransferase like family 2